MWVKRLSGEELSSDSESSKDTWKASRFLRCWRRSRSRARSRSSSSSLSKARMCSSKQISASSLSMSNHREEAQQAPHQGNTLSVPAPRVSKMLLLQVLGTSRVVGRGEQGLLGEAIGMMVHEKGSVII